MELTDSQSQALNKLVSFYKSRQSKQIALIGGAGVGKSFLLAYFLMQNVPSKSACILAPTHKAKGVLDDFVSQNGLLVRTSTIASFLGLRPVVTSKGNRYFGIPVNNPVKKTDRTLPQDYCVGKSTRIDPSLIIVDESSMIKDLEYRLLIYCAKQINFQIIWCGDDCQLPPIQKHRPRSKSLPFAKDNIEKVELTEIVRYSGKILELCNETRNNIKNETFNVPDYRHFRYRIPTVNKALPYFRDEKNCQIIAWLNRTVNNYNDDIRESLFGELAEEHPVLYGERIVINSFVRLTDDCFINNGTSCYVESVSSHLAKFPDIHYDKLKWLGDFVENITELLPDKIIWQVLEVNYQGVWGELFFVEEKHKKKWKEFLKQLSVELNVWIGKNKPSKALRGKIWKTFYDIQDINLNFAYGYAITADKSQGSSYDTAIVDGKDILRKQNLESLKRFYVAISRAKNELFIG